MGAGADVEFEDLLTVDETDFFVIEKDEGFSKTRCPCQSRGRPGSFRAQGNRFVPRGWASL